MDFDKGDIYFEAQGAGSLDTILSVIHLKFDQSFIGY